MFFVNLNIIEQQHVAGVKSPLLRIIDDSRRVVEGRQTQNFVSYRPQDLHRTSVQKVDYYNDSRNSN